MKASLKFRDEQQDRNPLLRAKIPITVLGFPLVSGIAAGDPEDLSFDLRTNSINGPSLKLSYNPNTTTKNPFSLSLKSGVGIFGSPRSSPLIMSAHFSLFGNPNPTFSLQIKPQFGDFALKKTAVSASLPNPVPNPNPNPNPDPPKENGGDHLTEGAGYAPVRQLPWRDTTEFQNDGEGLLTGVAVTAKTVLPVAKRAVMKFRWGVNFSSDFSGKKKLPFLTVDKIGIERVENQPEASLKPSERSAEEVEILKGMCLWMRREVETLQIENMELKQSLEGMRSSGVCIRSRQRESDDLAKKSMPSADSSSNFERWRSKKKIDGEEKGGRESKKSESTRESDVGEELKRAIKAASS